MKEKPDTKIIAIYKRLKSLKDVLDYQKEKMRDIEERLSISERKVGEMNNGIRDVIRQIEMSIPIDYDILPVYTEYGSVSQWKADQLVSEGKLKWCKGD